MTVMTVMTAMTVMTVMTTNNAHEPFEPFEPFGAQKQQPRTVVYPTASCRFDLARMGRDVQAYGMIANNCRYGYERCTQRRRLRTTWDKTNARDKQVRE